MRIGIDRSILTLGLLSLLAATMALAGCQPIPAPSEAAESAATTEQDRANGDRYLVSDVEFLGEVVFPTGYAFADTEVGGLSAIAYDAANTTYYLLSDDRSQHNPARFYNASIDLTDGVLDEGDVVFAGVTTLLDVDGQPYGADTLDPEGMALSVQGTLFISSEGNAGMTPPLAPFVDEFALDGSHLRSLALPAKYLPSSNGTVGVRNNLAFESLTVTPDGRYLITAVENALAQDGPIPDLEQGSLSRVLVLDAGSGEAVREMVYPVEPIPVAPEPASGDADNGLSDMVALDTNGTYLALERNYAEGKGNSVAIYQARAEGALDVLALDSLFLTDLNQLGVMDPPIAKDLLVNLADLGVTPDNVEGMTLGPLLPDGRQSLILVSDNNFSAEQKTQVIALALTLDRVPAVMPVVETPRTVDSDDAPEGSLDGDSDDPSIWVHPSDPAQSLVICTLKDGGFVVFDLAGEIVQHFEPAEYGSIRYNNGDILYGFDLDGVSTDLVAFSDRQNDTVAVYSIDAVSGELTDVTSARMVESVFGVDDGEATAYGLGAYQSPATGQVYVFVTQAGGNLVAQVELTADDSGKVTGTVVRTLEIPLNGRAAEDQQTEGMVVDQQLGFLYVGTEDEHQIYKYVADADGADEPVAVIANDAVQADLEGVIIYYGPGDSGYLLVSSQGNSSYALFERAGDNAYVGSIVVGDNGEIDQANESDGADVTNVALGSAFPQGLLVVQDGANDPQYATQDEEELENTSTNFKFVPWEEVANAFNPPLLIDTESYSPR